MKNKKNSIHTTKKSPIKNTSIKIKCRGKKCNTIHEYKNEYPLELTCKCGFTLVKNGLFYPKK